jgi:hypothetical protein
MIEDVLEYVRMKRIRWGVDKPATTGWRDIRR